MRPSILIYVQHLLGTGHVRRAALLARALDEIGFAVHLVSGGRPIMDLSLGGVRFHQLPPIAAADESFRTLVDERRQPIDNAFRIARRDQLLALFDRCRPAAVIVEMYPFGRRQLAFEIQPLLDRARASRPRALLVSSVRDIVQDRAPHAVAAMAEAAGAFDHILIHGDPAVVEFGASFPLVSILERKLHYTGYVIPHPIGRGKQGDPGWGEVIVSSGGGAVGHALLGTALRARSLTTLRTAPWRLLAGSNLGESDFRSLQRLAVPGTIVERARPDFDRLVANCRLSISQAGYNTIMEVVAARIPAVVVPYEGQGQTEQVLRADRLAHRGLVETVAEADLSPEGLAGAIDRAASRPVPAELDIKLDGAIESARLMIRWLDSDQSPQALRIS
jgi:predicted glycosyltransferase